MGWWTTGHNDDVMGDRPADFLGEQLDEIAGIYQKQRHRKPTWQEILDGLASAFQIKPEELYTDAATISVRKIVAETSKGRFSSREGEIAKTEIVSALREVFTYIASAYKDAKDRKPRLTEIASCLKFVLGGNLARYLTDAEGTVLEAIVIEVEDHEEEEL